MGKPSVPSAKRLCKIYNSLRTESTGESTAALTHALGTLNPAQLAAFERDGIVVLRGFFREGELDAIASPIRELQAEPDSPVTTSHGNVTKFNCPDFQGLRRRPSLATASFDHPRVVQAVQDALGEDAELMQFGALTWAPDAGGVGLHYDYKPFRVVGSSLDWMFCIVPLTDYEEHDGPLLVRPNRCFPLSHSFPHTKMISRCIP